MALNLCTSLEFFNHFIIISIKEYIKPWNNQQTKHNLTISSSKSGLPSLPAKNIYPNIKYKNVGSVTNNVQTVSSSNQNSSTLKMCS